MNEEFIMNYKELCDFFQEEKTSKGKSRQLQFDRWRKEYNIEKVEGKNQYSVSKKKYVETINQKQLQKNMKFSTLLAPIIYTTLMNVEGNVIALSSLEEQRLFSLVNPKFGMQSLCLGALANELGIEPKDIYGFRDAIWEINAQTIRNVINSMSKMKILLKNTGYKCKKLSNGKWFIADGSYASEILSYINMISNREYSCIYSKLKSKEEKTKVKELVSEHFGLETFYSADILYLDKNSIEIVYNTEIKENVRKILTEQGIIDNLIEINDNNCIRISKSKRKKLTDISKTNKDKMINTFISKSEKECAEDYDKIIKNSCKLDVVSKNIL